MAFAVIVKIWLPIDRSFASIGGPVSSLVLGNISKCLGLLLFKLADPTLADLRQHLLTDLL